MSALRILHVVPYYEHAWAYGGIPRVATAMTRGLARRGHAVTVCTTDARDERSRLSRLDRSSDEPGVQVRVFRNVSNRLAYHWQFFTPVGLSSHLRSRARDFDIAHLHACRNLPGVFAAAALLRARVPYVISPNGTAPAIERRFVAKRVFDWTAGRAPLTESSRVLATSVAETRQLRDLGIPPERIEVVPNPIDDEELELRPDPRGFRESQGLGSTPLVLYLGKLTPRKGVDVLLRAFGRLRRPDATLVIAGNDMGTGTAIDVLTGTLGLESRVRRVGLLEGRERLDALAAANVVVYPSRDEVFGLVAAEALMCETPVVVCDDSGCGEIVADAGGGLSVPFGDAMRLAVAIETILASEEHWKSRARAARAFVARRFAAAAVCERLERIYRDVLVEHRGAA